MKKYIKAAALITVVFLSVFSFTPFVSAVTVQITQDTIIDLTGLDRTVYAATGSACDSMVVDGGSLTVSGVPAAGVFILSLSDRNIFQVGAQSGTVNFIFTGGYLVGGRVIQWTESASVVSVEHRIAVASANTWYYLKIDGVFVENYLSDASGQLVFARTVGSGNAIYSLTKGSITGTTSGSAPKIYSDSIVINQGAASAQSSAVQLVLKTDSASQMAVCNNAEFTGCPLESYQTSKSWTLTSGDGVKTVYVLFVSSAGNKSPIASAIIILSSVTVVSGSTVIPPVVPPPTVTTQPQTTTPAVQEPPATATTLLPLVTFEKPISQMTSVEIAAKISQILAALETLKTMLQEIQAAEPSSDSIPVGYQFTGVLKYGQTSDSVKYLQIFLKAQGEEIYPEGLLTGWFGPKTKAAVIRFQEKYVSEILTPLGLTAGTGNVGQSTRSKINAMLAQ